MKQSTKERVLFLTPDRKIDRRTLLMARSLKADGWDVGVIAMPHSDTDVDPPWVQRIDLSDGPAREASSASLYRQLSRRFGVNRPFIRWLKAIAWRVFVDQETYYAKLFATTLADAHADVVVACDLPMLPAAHKFAEDVGASLVFDSHELYAEQNFPAWQQRGWREIEGKYISACSLVITVNRSIANELEDRYSITDVAVILNAERKVTLTPSNYFHATYGLPSDAVVLLYQGAISVDRNLPNLVRAMTKLESDKVHLVLLGNGELVGELMRLVADLKLEKRVHHHAEVTQAQLLELTMAADIGVVPYQPDCLNNTYCTPNKLFEFIAAGLPIVSTDLPELRRFVHDNDIGWVGDTSTPSAFARLLSQPLADETAVSKARANLMQVREHLCWEEEEQKLKSLFGRFLTQ